MSDDGARPRRAAPRHGGPARRRAVCVWLGTLASWRGGMVGRLVAEYGGVSAVLDRPSAELAAFLRPRVRAAAGRGPRAQRADPLAEKRRAAQASELAADTRRFEAVLATAPERCVAGPQRPGQTVVAWCDPLYPPGLRQLADPPLCLFVAAGAADLEIARRLRSLCGTPAVAVVGARSPSPYGTEMAAVLGRDLALRGVIVISGLALGVDAAAQAAALRVAAGSEQPATVAVLGCGPDVAYPPSNASLHREVLRSGLVVSEFAWGVPARAWRFPARNRVMAALSRGVVVVEGSARSGARLTAGFGLDLGREVLAVPGEAGKRLSQAPHALLRQGAPLCESADDVVAAIAGVRFEGEEPAGELPSTALACLLEARCDDGRLTSVMTVLEKAPATADEVADACGLRVQVAAALLSELEIEGLAVPAGAGAFRLRRT